MMMFFNIQTALHQFQGDLGADVVDLVGGRHREIAFLVARPVAQVVAFPLPEFQMPSWESIS